MSNRRRDKGGGHEGGDERWLLTYADMITLLLALFIVLFAMSTIDAKKFDNVRRSLSETFKGDVLEEPGHVLDGSQGPGDPQNANQVPDKQIVSQLIQASNATAARFASEQQKLQGVAKQTKLEASNDVSVSQSPNGSIVLRVAGDALFATGSSELKPGVRGDLLRIERELSGFGARIRIGGHTDGQPIAGGNMALSQDRARAVHDLFRSAGFHGYIEANGYADQQPVQPPQHPQDSVPKNRRIEITVLAPGADDPRPRSVQMIAAVKGMKRAESPLEPSPAPLTVDVQQQIDEGIAADLAQQSRELG